MDTDNPLVMVIGGMMFIAICFGIVGSGQDKAAKAEEPVAIEAQAPTDEDA